MERKEEFGMKWYHIALALVGFLIAADRLAKALNEH